MKHAGSSAGIAPVALFLGLLLVPAGSTPAARPQPAGPTPVETRAAAWRQHVSMAKRSPFRGLPWRCIGPVIQGGRVVDIEVVPDHPYTFYVAYASGGLWRTRNNGVTLEPIFDDQPTIIMGDVAIDPSRPDTVWVGTGENNSSRSSYGGAGVFRSDDGGDTWEQVGLWGADRIGRILVDPGNSRRVWVAALGPLYTRGGTRGIFRTDDRGVTWKKVLNAGEGVGFIDLVMDPRNPEVLYAASWDRLRRPWNFREGGPGSGIWKTTDGGENWKRLDGGFPRGDHVGRIGLAVAASRPDTLYALVDNQELLPEEQWDLGDGAVTAKRLRTMTRDEFLRQDPEEIEDFLRSYDLDPELDARKLLAGVREGEITLDDLRRALADADRQLFETDVRGAEVWRSDDAGRTWRRTHEQPIREMVYTYGYYFGQIRVAPDDPERIYLLGVPMLSSADGGKTFSNVQGRRMHVDHHSLWVDPAHPRRLIAGNDGGLYMSFDGGKSWLALNPVPVGQFYTVTVDDAKPYNVYGGLQDNGVMKGSSRSRPETGPRWKRIGGGDGMYVQVDPRDNATVYMGYQFGHYFRADPDGKRRQVRPINHLKEPALRYNWSTPVLLSPHNADVVYFGANRLFRSLDRGETWNAISPDLSRSAERGDVPFATITTLSESPLSFGLVWAGTDDGMVHVSRDGGVRWDDVSDGLPADRWVTRVEASHHRERTAYVSLSGYRDDDMMPYIFRTDDLGATWTDISAGLPVMPVNVVREDPVNENVVYVGTDRGAFVSLDRGETWEALSGGLPNVPVHDLAVHPTERELVAGTHGRSVWVLDVLPIQELTEEVREKAVLMFPLEPVDFQRRWKHRWDRWFHRPEDEPYLDVPFYVAEAGAVIWSVTDGEGRVLRTERLEATPGVNSYRWDLLLDPDLAVAAERKRLAAEKKARRKRHRGEGADAKETERAIWAEAVRLERPVYATPGTYRIRVEAGGESSETELEIRPPKPREPRVPPKPRLRGEKKEEERNDGGR